MVKKNSFWEGIFFGGFLGSLFGLLFAPLSGRDARKKITEKIEEIKIAPEEIKEKIIDPTLNAIDSGISRLDKALDEAKQAIRDKRVELEKEKSNEYKPYL